MTLPIQATGTGIPLPKALVDEDMTPLQEDARVGTAIGGTATPSVELILPRAYEAVGVRLDTELMTENFTVPAGTIVEMVIADCIRARYTGLRWEFLVQWKSDRPSSWVASNDVGEGPSWVEVSLA